MYKVLSLAFAGIALAGCAPTMQPSAAGDITLASSAGATSAAPAGAPVRQQSVRGNSPPASTKATTATPTASGATTNVVFASEGGGGIPSGGDIVASAAPSGTPDATSSGESIFSSLMSFLKPDSSSQKSASVSAQDAPNAPADSSMPEPGASAGNPLAGGASQSERISLVPASGAAGASHIGLSPRSAGPTPIGQSSAPTRVQSASPVPLGNDTIPWRVIESSLVKPGCTGAECPSLKIRRLAFTGHDRFNKFLDETLVSLAELETKQTAPFKTLAAFQKYFFAVAKPRWEVVLEAGVRRETPALVVVQLDSYVFSGGAHGASTTQYINWLPKVDRLLTLETMILPSAAKKFEEALRRQHAEWLKTNTVAQENPAAYSKAWPFTMSDNVALLAEGLAVTYDPYVLAPYSFGRPTFVIPYSELNGILRPELMPG